ncbi:MAG: hypothetical protein Q7J04_06860, partial [Microcella sp.]|nr:hypothetical protein [Microcella sp.]
MQHPSDERAAVTVHEQRDAVLTRRENPHHPIPAHVVQALDRGGRIGLHSTMVRDAMMPIE